MHLADAFIQSDLQVSGNKKKIVSIIFVSFFTVIFY